VHHLSNCDVLAHKGIGQLIPGLPAPSPQLAPEAALHAHRLHYVKQVRRAMLNVNQASGLIRYHSFMNLEYPQAIIPASAIIDQYVRAQSPNTCTLS
jgi:hypothetical protein